MVKFLHHIHGSLVEFGKHEKYQEHNPESCSGLRRSMQNKYLAQLSVLRFTMPGRWDRTSGQTMVKQCPLI